MSYLTKEQFIDRFGQQELDDLMRGIDEVAAERRLSDAIRNAESLVNSYLARRYDTPVTGVSLVSQLTGDIARFLLASHRATAEMRERYEDAIKYLKDVASSKADLAGATDDESSELGSDDSRILISDVGPSRLNLESY